MNASNPPPEWPVDEIRHHDVDRAALRTNVRARGGGLNWTTLALIAGLLLVALVAYFATSRNPDQDKLTGSDVAQRQADRRRPEKLCASKSTYDLIKRELFRRAAQVRGSDQAAFDKLAAMRVAANGKPGHGEPG